VYENAWKKSHENKINSNVTAVLGLHCLIHNSVKSMCMIITNHDQVN